jgi:transglutaminase-like putative cysteine protease
MPNSPLQLERSVQFAMAAMTALGTLLLGLGQQSVFLPCVALLSSVSSVVLCDIRQSFRLNRHIANMAALLAVAYAMTDFYSRQDSETQLLAIANLLVYLQVVLQFQEKSLRVYWSLSVLSLLQVVVASALNLSFSFGPLLAVYLVVALTALSLLFVYRETERFHASAQPLPEALGPIGPNRRWPLGQGDVRWSGVAGEDPGRPLVGRRMARHIIGMGLVTLVITVLVFYGMPRYRKRVWQGPGDRGTSMVGFNDEVSLGEMGRILQSDQLVMRVSFEHAGRNEKFAVHNPPYFRGATLANYELRRGRGRWKQYGSDEDPLPPLPTNQGGVIQDITLVSAGHAQMSPKDNIPLFSTYPVFRDNLSQRELIVDRRNRLLQIEAEDVVDTKQFRYITRSGEFNGNLQVRLSVDSRAEISEEMDRLKFREMRSLAGLIALANKVVTESQAVEPLAKALALESHFRSPGNYEYSLDPDVVRNRELDPIEDFVTNHRTGHCEYFASALVLMLRSQGIPARMVVGYHGGEYNSLGSYYLVRQKHAHAWVEAYLQPGQYPVEQLATGADDSGVNGAWLRLDPTPPDYDLEVEDGETTLLAQVADMLDYAQLLWTDYVLGLNSQRQRDSIYGPILATVEETREMIVKASEGPVLLYVFMGMTLLALLALAVIFGRRYVSVSHRDTFDSLLGSLGIPLRWVTGWFGQSNRYGTHRPQVHVAFYERLETMLQRQGLVRLPGQTQREFAAAAGGRLADLPHLQPVAGVPRRVAEAFYRVRFGGAPLDSREEQAVEQALRDLEAALAQGRA